MKKHKDFLEELNMLGDRYWGKYLMNKFFIQIKTGKSRSEIPSYDFEKFNFSDDDQITLQKDNYPAIFHEYIHYIHEVTTMVGMVGFYYQFVNRVYFSIYAAQMTSSEYPTIPEFELKLIKKTNNTLASLDGGKINDIQELTILKIIDIQLQDYMASFPNIAQPLEMQIPVILFQAFNKKTGQYSDEEIFLGKFYLYEGLAHNLDRLVQIFSGMDPEKKNKISSEYLLMEKIAEFLVPKIELREILEVASLSLSYLNCGEYFIGFLKELQNSRNIKQTVKELKLETIQYLKKKLPLIEKNMRDLIPVLKQRAAIKNAFEYLTNVMIEGTRQRIDNPVFEVDVVYSKKFNDLTNYTKMCPTMYEFDEDFDTYRRDFTSTDFNPEFGGNMLTLLTHLDYYSTAMVKKEEHVCPLYTTCSHPIRKVKGIQCKTTPRLAYEDEIEFGWCHYGLGIAYMKRIDEP